MFYKLESFVVFFKLLNCLLLSRLIFFLFNLTNALGMPPIPLPLTPSFITAVKDLCIVNILVKLLNFLFSEVY